MIVWISVAAFAASCGLTAWLLHNSGVGRLVDHPNQRSSHTKPTPRGGGLSMVITTTCGVAILYAAGWLSIPLLIVFAVGGNCVAAIGFWDDVHSAPIAARMSVHIGAAILAVYCLGGISIVRTEVPPVFLGAVGALISVVSIVWVLNLFNFMDGIDGIAASEGAFVLLASAALRLLVGQELPAQIALSLILGATCLGFLVWNWPPASIFMGDVGSGYLGYTIPVLAIESSHRSAINIYVWLILGGVFVVDATLTLVRRMLRLERVHQAHRTHAYQWLARRWNSHSNVTFAVIAINFLWLLPLAAAAVVFPSRALWICFVAFAPLVAIAFLSGSGRAE